ncbi:rho GTPase-activating protein 2-like [Curcuma longa]|uniref:rho GTPase-activating protein 2-like n=1 Tax=Curcuma longa TaxID=136217 RepID=UPI003D9E9908
MARFSVLHDGGFAPSPTSRSLCQEEEDDEEVEEEFPSSSPLILPGSDREKGGNRHQHHHHSSATSALVAALRKSLVICSVGADEGCGVAVRHTTASSAVEIGWPTDVRHVAHVTFDRFGGFLGLPVELEPEVSPTAPSASVSVFGVSVESMQCCYDDRGNSVPTILLLMQRHLYSEGGLQVEGIFRINAENDQELLVREQLNGGTVPHRIDLHCLAGLIKAWFRELPKGVLDALTPDQVMHCNTEEACTELLRMLPPTEAALLDWVINLMADVVEHEDYNKMNARNIAMVFAPNMTQMADPLTALIHAVQVMNFLRTLIQKTLRNRKEASFMAREHNLCSESPSDKDEAKSYTTSETPTLSTREITMDGYDIDRVGIGKFLLDASQSLGTSEDSFGSPKKKSENAEQFEFISAKISHADPELDGTKEQCKCRFVYRDVERVMSRLRFRKAVQCKRRKPVFQLSRSTKRSAELVDSEEKRENWT